MKQITQVQRNGGLSVQDVPMPVLRDAGVLVRTAYSLISSGTERTKMALAKKGLLGKALARPDQVRQVLESIRQIGLGATYQKVSGKLDALSPLGYSCAGVVLAVGREFPGFSAGDRVACAGAGFANHAELVYVPGNLIALVPPKVELEEAAFCALGAIALQGLRQADPNLGEVVGVIGLGLVGLLTVQLLRAAGCRVVGLDINQDRCDLARKLGADIAITTTDPALRTSARRFNSAGLDAVILTAATRSNEPIALAGELSRNRGRVIVVGAVGMDIPRSPFYEKELDVRLSRSYGPGRYDREYEEKGRDYPIDYVRWTEGRNLAAFLDLIAQGKVDVKILTTHRIPIAEAERAYELIESNTQETCLGVVIDYGLAEAEPIAMPASVMVRLKPDAARLDKVGLALVGAGSFAQAMLLPHLRGHPHIRLRTVVTPSGLTARSVADRYGFELCSSQVETVLNDPETGVVLIASRHNSHADLTARALLAGKAVFVEKPLALDRTQLQNVKDSYAASPSSLLMVGFNRRFAPLVTDLREFVAGIKEPMLLHYRVNAGFVPRDHWTQDADEGGGRILGEVCHFVDLMLHLANQPPVEVYACALPDRGRYNNDNLTVMLRFADGSVGTILYSANGDRGLEKERLEIFGGGRVAVMEDFRQLTLASGGKRKIAKSRTDKGHRAEILAFIEAARQGGSSPIPFDELILTTEVTFAILDAIMLGQPVSLKPKCESG